MKIYTILKDGEALMPEVLQGILNQTIECCLIPITSTCETEEKSRAKNWNRAKELCQEDIFIGMDSDVILIDKNAIEMIIAELKKKEFDMITLPTRGLGTGHQVFAVWKNKLPELKAVEGNCTICEATTKLKYKCLDFEQKEAQRPNIELTNNNNHGKY